jgi:hypothetical protein
MDKAARRQLVESLPPNVRPHPFSAVGVAPAQFSSDEMINAMRRCDGMISIRGGQSEQSFWVTFQRDYARRIGCPLYLYNPSRKVVDLFATAPMGLRALPVYAPGDAPLAEAVIHYLRVERSFEVWPYRGPLYLPADGPSLATTINQISELTQPLTCTVLFWSGSVATNQSLQPALATLVSRPRSGVVASVHRGLQRMKAVPNDLYLELAPQGQLDTRRADDLMVRLYWAALLESRLAP